MVILVSVVVVVRLASLLAGVTLRTVPAAPGRYHVTRHGASASFYTEDCDGSVSTARHRRTVERSATYPTMPGSVGSQNEIAR